MWQSVASWLCDASRIQEGRDEVQEVHHGQPCTHGWAGPSQEMSFAGNSRRALLASAPPLPAAASRLRARPPRSPTRVLRIGVSSNPDGTALNPALDEYSGEGFFALAYAPIFHLKLSGSIGAALATNWHYVGTGNKRFEFTLRHDTRFSDGGTVTGSKRRDVARVFRTHQHVLW